MVFILLILITTTHIVTGSTTEDTSVSTVTMNPFTDGTFTTEMTTGPTTEDTSVSTVTMNPSSIGITNSYTSPVPGRPGRPIGCGKKGDIVFVLDSSGSVGSSNWKIMLKFVQDVINIFTIGKNDVQVGVDIYANFAFTRIRLNSYQSKTQLMDAVKRISFTNGGTATNRAIDHLISSSFSQSHGSRSGVPKIGIILTDGRSNSQFSTIAAANAARKKGIELFAIGIGSSVNTVELKGVANDPDSIFYFSVHDFKALQSIESRLASETCQNLEPITGCKAGADIIFLVDNSGSVGSSNFNTTLTFISDIVDGLKIGIKKDKFQVGVLTFHTPVKAEFNLDEYQDKQDVKNAIMEIRYEGGGTNTGGAIKYLHTTAFARASGHRPGYPMIGILITDGYSSNKAETRKEAMNARLKGIKMFSIGIGNAMDTTELESVASEPKSQFVFTAASFKLLKSIESLLLSKTCEVADITCWGKTDVVFLLEDSCHIGETNFNKMLQMVENLVQEIPIGNGNIQIGVNTFKCTAKTEFVLGKYKTGKDIIKAVQRIKYTGGKVSIGKAIEYTRKNSFPENRSKAKKLMIILTNGSDKALSKTLGEAQKARNSNIKMMVIGIGDYTHQDCLQGMATVPHDKYIFSQDSFDPLRNMRDVLIQRKCSA
ncbi:collagen alpha-1(XII) chain-like isoform X2 [Mytilus californianus]|uniref:collagen alpha-1(XII) chain-like isoform X2 n=1 Tax=Mytilus californianus TaxID=6549 RepID=UPI0022470462|nr:collagen alpha-1(XII) chain-like isoform X2 [Mytilus californianus]